MSVFTNYKCFLIIFSFVFSLVLSSAEDNQIKNVFSMNLNTIPVNSVKYFTSYSMNMEDQESFYYPTKGIITFSYRIEKPDSNQQFTTIFLNIMQLHLNPPQAVYIDVLLTNNYENIRSFNLDDFQKVTINAGEYSFSSISHSTLRDNYIGLFSFPNTKAVTIKVTLSKLADEENPDTFFKALKVFQSTCDLSCKSCDPNEPSVCLSCANNMNLSKGKCICNDPQEYHRELSDLDKPITCVLNEADGLCKTYMNSSKKDENDGIQFCSECRGNSYLNMNAPEFTMDKDDIDSDGCRCTPGNTHKDFTSICTTDLEYCEDEDLNTHTDEIFKFLQTKGGFNYTVTTDVENITQQTFYKIKLNHPYIPQDTLNLKFLAFRLSYIKHMNDVVSITKKFNEWSHDSLNINRNDLVNGRIKDCRKKGNDYLCNFILTAYHPCLNTIYLSMEIDVWITENGEVNTTQEIDTSSVQLFSTVPCIKKGKCSITGDFTVKVEFCEDATCLNIRNPDKPFYVKDKVWIKTNFQRSDDPHMPAILQVDAYYYDFYDNNSNLIVSLPKEGNEVLMVKQENIFGFPLIQTKEKVEVMKIQNKIQNLFIKVYFKVLNTNRMSEGKMKYEITTPISLNIPIDPEFSVDILYNYSIFWIISSVIAVFSTLLMVLCVIRIKYIRKERQNDGQKLSVAENIEMGTSSRSDVNDVSKANMIPVEG